MRLLVLAIAMAAVVAGCVTPAVVDPTVGAPTGRFLDPIVDEHDHASFAEHARSTASMSLVGWTPLGEDGKPYSYIGEMDTFGNLTVVQVLGRGSMPGFVVVDVSDPANPTPIGRAEMPYSYVVDVKWSPDGKYVFAAAQAQTNRARSDKTVADDPFGYVVTANGFTQWDMSDPTKPVAVAGGMREPGGCHMLSVKEIGGELFVFCVADLVEVFAFAGGGAWTQVATLTPPVEQGGLQRTIDEALGAGTGAHAALLSSTGPHDITVEKDPLEERIIASVSYWDLGLVWFDVSDPRDPQMLGTWGGEDGALYVGNVHGAALYDHHGDRLAVVGPELTTSDVPGLWILDVNDFANPKVVGEWAPPGEHLSQGLLLTTHQFQVLHERIYLAYNHAGAWVLDLHTIMKGEYAGDPARPDVLGYYLPHQEVELYNPEINTVPGTWDVNVKDGRIFASDRYTGFYVLQYAGDAAGDAAITSST